MSGKNYNQSLLSGVDSMREIQNIMETVCNGKKLLPKNYQQIMNALNSVDVDLKVKAAHVCT